MQKYHVFDKSGKILNAEISYETNEHIETYFIESRGGAKGGPQERNPDYFEALEALLTQQKAQNSVIEDILVDSKTVQNLLPKDRRVNVEDLPFPIRLRLVEDIPKLRRAIGNIVKNIGQKDGSRGGNLTKKLLLRFSRQANIEINHSYPDEGLCNRDKQSLKFSGPPPSDGRKASPSRQTLESFVYVLWLKGLKDKTRCAIKVGYTSDFDARHKQLNKEIIGSLTGLAWVEHKRFSYTNPRDAFDREQEIHRYLASYRYVGHREIYDLNLKDFDELIAKII